MNDINEIILDAPMPLPTAEDQGLTDLCWLYSIHECFTAVKKPFNIIQVYEHVKGKPFVLPGEGGSIYEARNAILYAAQITGANLLWYGTDGSVPNLDTLNQIILDRWFVWIGVDMHDLAPCPPRSYHALIIDGEEGELANPTVVDAIVVNSWAGKWSVMKIPLTELYKSLADFSPSAPAALAFQITN